MRNANEIVEQPIRLQTLTDRLTRASVEFLQNHAATNKEERKPFALYHSFTNVHTPIVPGRKFKGESDHGRYGDR